MINVKKLVNNVYYNKSRDFQVVGRTLEVIFNYLQTEIDLAKYLNLTNNTDNKLLPLIATTLGFESRHTYNTNNLKGILSTFSYLLKNKGTKKAIEDAVTVLLRSQNIDKDFEVVIDKKTNEVIIYIPYNLQDTILLEDLFDYILPAGCNYNFIKTQFGDEVADGYNISDSINWYKFSNARLGQVSTGPTINSGDGGKWAKNTLRPDDASYNTDLVEGGEHRDLSMNYTSVIIGKDDLKYFERQKEKGEGND